MRAFHFWSVLVAVSCHTASAQHRAEPPIRSVAETVASRLAHPLLQFDVVKMPRVGVVESLSGPVEVLREAKEWLQLSNGANLTHGSRVRIGAGAALVVRFTPSEKMEFLAAPKERWVVFEVSGKP